MEARCEHSLYFPAAPLSSLSQPAEYRTLPRRSHVFLGETVQVLLVLRSRDGEQQEGGPGVSSWRDAAGSLSAVAAVSVAESQQLIAAQEPQQSSDSEDGAEEPGQRGQAGTDGSCRAFTSCRPLFTHSSAADDGAQHGREQAVLVLDDEVVFCLSVSLETLPFNTVKAKITVTLWKQEVEKMEVREHGYLTILQLRRPTQTFREDSCSAKTQVSAVLNILQPPSIQCQQISVCGKHLTLLKVLNSSSQQEVCLRELRIVPNYNSSFLPVMPDGSVLIVDNVCHQSAEITMASFYRLDNQSSRLPSMLSALEEQNFLFQLQLQDKEDDDTSQGLEIPLVAVLQWYTSKLPLSRFISTHYALPSIRLDRPQLVMTASCPRSVRPHQLFWVRYTLLNDLQDFLTIRLHWTDEGSRSAYGTEESRMEAVVCQCPLSNLGQCRKGSTLYFTVAFQILQTGLFELSQHMKLKLKFTASMSGPPSSLLNQSQSFSQRQPYRSPIIRTGSVMEPLVGSPMGRPLSLTSDQPLLSLDKIAKRRCEVFVLKPTTCTQSR
ncbi:trafficking protein particle complex subunit 14 [Genypterus blacodes]|uniref:trafficking protein particle complex subunit 14 n=1 Tax=Genypterus blacodes TaxID=154954 RepID=UPI003F7742DA